MTFNSFLTTYWVHITAAAFAIWSIYLHFKSNISERKKNLQAVYLELTGVINDFHVNCFNIFFIEPQFIEYKIEVHGELNNAYKLLNDILLVKQKGLLENHPTLIASLQKLKDDFKLITNGKSESEKHQEIQLKKNEMILLLEEFKEEKSRNEALKKQVIEILESVEKKVEIFDWNNPQKVISLSKVLNKFINVINTLPGWQLISSKAVLKTIQDLESACLRLKSVILDVNIDRLDMIQIVDSPEFKNVWTISEEAIKKMRSEV